MPSIAVEEPTRIGRPTLLWVRCGAARVAVDDESYDLGAGQALWIPAETPHAWTTEPDSLVVPVSFPDDPSGWRSNGVVQLVVPPDWDDWLVHRFACALHWGYRGEQTGGAVLGWLQTASVATAAPHRPALPPLPRSPAARAVVERLLEGDVTTSLTQFATDLQTSGRTVQRQLVAETTATFSQWRRAARVDLAIRHLAQGHTVSWTAHEVGYATSSALTHAFSVVTGRRPSDFMAPPGEATGSVEAMTTLHRSDLAPAPPPIPAVPQMHSIDDFDLAIWAYRGRAHVRAGAREEVLETGDIVWLPAGTPNSISIDPGGILLPLGYRLGFRSRHRYELQVLETSPEHEAFLLYTVVANHTDSRPRHHDPHAITDQIEATHQLAAAVDLDQMPPSVRHLMSALTRDPANRHSLAAFAAELGVERQELAAQFRHTVGQSFPEWRARLRMTLARNLLWQGLTPSTVSRRLGYAHLSGFSRLFTAANEISPREFVRTQVQTF